MDRLTKLAVVLTATACAPAPDSGAGSHLVATAKTVDACACPLTQGYWKNHPEDAPVAVLSLGYVDYAMDEWLELLWTPTRGDTSMILAHQLIATKLNVAAGSPAGILETVTRADDWIADHDDGEGLPLGVKGAEGNLALHYAWRLDTYNNGLTLAGCADEGEAEPDPWGIED